MSRSDDRLLSPRLLSSGCSTSTNASKPLTPTTTAPSSNGKSPPPTTKSTTSFTTSTVYHVKKSPLSNSAESKEKYAEEWSLRFFLAR